MRIIEYSGRKDTEQPAESKESPDCFFLKMKSKRLKSAPYITFSVVKWHKSPLSPTPSRAHRKPPTEPSGQPKAG